MPRSAPAAWSPLAVGETAAAALAAAAAIAADLAGDPGLAPAIGLGGGQAGLALFFAYLDRSLGSATAGEQAERHLDRAIALLAEETAPAANLFQGFAGVAWVAEHLAPDAAAGEDEDAEDPNDEIDTALLSILGRSPWRGEFDLLNGLVGWGVYALERLPRPAAAEMLRRVVARLAEGCEQTPHGIAWRGRDPGGASRPPDAGMAHGAAGVIALLARMLQESAAGAQAAPLLAAAVADVLGRPPQGEEEGESDLAWCAGDAGLAVALLAAGRAAGREDWERAARRLAAGAAERFRDQAGGFDPALCHGTAGLSHLFHHLHLATGDRALLAAARHWLGRTLALRRPGAGIGGYLCRGRQADGSAGWITNPGFLGGAAGIGLALLAAATPIEPAWDRLLLLSGRAPRSA
jgi:hypothetical protein